MSIQLVGWPGIAWGWSAQGFESGTVTWSSLSPKDVTEGLDWSFQAHAMQVSYHLLTKRTTKMGMYEKLLKYKV